MTFIVFLWKIAYSYTLQTVIILVTIVVTAALTRHPQLIAVCGQPVQHQIKTAVNLIRPKQFLRMQQ